MKTFLCLSLAVLVSSLALVHVRADDQQVDEAKIKANLAKLDPEDQKLAEQQKYCVIESENRLGAMGTPIKVVLNGEPVFLCCKGCVKAAKKNPEATLAKAKALREKNAESPPK